MKGGTCARCQVPTFNWKISVDEGSEYFWLCTHCKNLWDFENELGEFLSDRDTTT